MPAQQNNIDDGLDTVEEPSQRSPLPYPRPSRRPRCDSGPPQFLTLTPSIIQAPAAMLASVPAHNSLVVGDSKRMRLSAHVFCASLSADVVTCHGGAEDRATTAAAVVATGRTHLDKHQAAAITVSPKSTTPHAASAAEVPVRIRVVSRRAGENSTATLPNTPLTCIPAVRRRSTKHSLGAAATIPLPNPWSATVATEATRGRIHTSATAAGIARDTTASHGTSPVQSGGRRVTAKVTPPPTRCDSLVNPGSAPARSPSSSSVNLRPASRGTHRNRKPSNIQNTAQLTSHHIVVGNVDASEKLAAPLAGCHGNPPGEHHKKRNSTRIAARRSGSGRAIQHAPSALDGTKRDGRNIIAVEAPRRTTPTNTKAPGRRGTTKWSSHNVFSRLYQPPLMTPIVHHSPHKKNPPCAPTARTSHHRWPQRRMNRSSSVAALQQTLNSFVFPPLESPEQSVAAASIA